MAKTTQGRIDPPTKAETTQAETTLGQNLSSYLNNHSSETFHIWSMDTLQGLLSFYESRL